MSKPDIYKTITDKILAQLATGAVAAAVAERPSRQRRRLAATANGSSAF